MFEKRLSYLIEIGWIELHEDLYKCSNLGAGIINKVNFFQNLYRIDESG
jgi:hypothetical protein